MAVGLREVLATFGVKVEGLQELNAVGTALDGLVKKLAGALTVGALAGFVKHMVTVGASINDAAERTGVSSEEFQRLSYAIELAGGSAEGTERALILLQKNMKGGLGSKTAIQAFEDLADKIQKIKDPAKQTQMAMKYFGKSGAQLLPVLRQGAAGVRGLNQEFDDLGLLLGDDFVKAADEADDNFVRLKFQARAFGAIIGKDVVPLVSKAVTGLLRIGAVSSKFIQSTGGFAKLATGGGILGMAFGLAKGSRALGTIGTISGIGKRLGGMGMAAARAGKGVGGFAKTLWQLRKGLTMNQAAKLFDVMDKFKFANIAKLGQTLKGSLASGLSSATKGIRALANSNLFLIASFALIFLALDDFFTFLRGGDSLIGDWLKKNLGIEDTKALQKQLNEVWASIKQAFTDVKPALDQLWQAFQQFMVADGIPALITLFVQLVKVAAAGTIALASAAGAALKLAKGDSAGAKELIDKAGEAIMGKTKTLVSADGQESTTGEFGGLYGDSETKAKELLAQRVEGRKIASGSFTGPPTAAQATQIGTLNNPQTTTINVNGTNLDPIRTAEEVAKQQQEVNRMRTEQAFAAAQSYTSGTGGSKL